MRGYIAFVKKEFMENIRTFKLMILFIVFFIYGMISPLLAKLMPEIMRSVDMQGLTMVIPDPVIMDAYAQFYKNVSQTGLLVLVLIFGGMLTNEISRGTLVNVLTKGLSRKNVIFAKFTVAVMLWTASLLIAFVTDLGYTVYLFPDETVYNAIPALLALWLFGIFLIALIIFSSTLVRGGFACLMVVMLVVVALFMIDIIPGTEAYNPILLASGNVQMMAENYDFADVIRASCVAITAIAAMIAGAVTIFNRKAL